jgi:hypothetical protein
MILRLAFCILPILPAIWLGGCADTISSDAPPSSSTLLRDYEKTLTKSEQQAVITELKAESKKKGTSSQD